MNAATAPFDRVLIANRGEIAVRVARTLRRLGIESVAVYAPDEAGAGPASGIPHVAACDHAIVLEADGTRSPYLDIEQLVRIALGLGCDAVHPGYGFLAERAEAARAFTAAGVTWIGPSAAAIELLGDKIASKQTAQVAGVPVVPGVTVPDGDPDPATRDTAAAASAVAELARTAGLPLLLKATAGGGGKGMRRVATLDAVPDAVEGARREAIAAFGRGELLAERLVDPARHVEVQVAVDAHGGGWAIGERECSLQRRHQKLIEEAPASCLREAERQALHEAAVRLALAAGYRNLGTVEFLLDVAERPDAGPDAPRPFFFLEMNARLQVEHPVTELVHGLDLVEQQLRIAAGERLDLDAAASTVDGHAIEARVCAERVAPRATADGVTADFLPVIGPIVAYAEPTGPGVRVDSGLAVGVEVTTSFDPMLLKLVAHGRDREQARQRLDRALGELTVLGLETNAAFLRRLLDRPEVRDDRSTTTLVETLLDDPDEAPSLATPRDEARERALRAAAALRYRELTATGDGSAYGAGDGWRIAGRGVTRLRWRDADDRDVVVDLTVGDPGRTVHVRIVAAGGAEPATDAGDPTQDVAPTDPAWVAVDVAQASAGWRTATVGPWRWLHGPEGTWAWRDAPEVAAGSADVGGSLAAPLPGVVLDVRKRVGDPVTAGETVVVVESMKMELTVDAPHAGTVAALHVAIGDTVARGELLAAVDEEGTA
ncbi:MAG: acetyl/propionyl-CoA carboxylase subunit alpha [Patulibacter sp.]|nr:acetyl/propionyl-CoA carboxylase subunit alpha [Patulibacter sp.]